MQRSDRWGRAPGSRPTNHALPPRDETTTFHATLTPLIAVVTTVVVVIGATIAALANRAANRHTSRPLRLFSYGFGAITLGLLVGGVGGLVVGLGVEQTLLVQGTLVAPGFVLLLRSLYSIPRTVSA